MPAKTPILTEISQRIHALLEAGWNQTQIAESLGVTPAVISQLKHGDYKSRLEGHLASLEKLFEDDGLEVPSDSAAMSNAEIPTSYSDWLAEQLALLEISPAQLAGEASLSTLTINLILNGSTSSPQAGTRQKIQKALDSLSQGRLKTKAPSIPSTDKREPVIGILFTEEEILQVPNKQGVYVIHDRRGYPTYVGKGDVRSRLNSHRALTAFADKRVARTFSYVILQVGEDPETRKAAHREAHWLENIVTKFAGNTVLLNERLKTDLSDWDEDMDT